MPNDRKPKRRIRRKKVKNEVSKIKVAPIKKKKLTLSDFLKVKHGDIKTLEKYGYISRPINAIKPVEEIKN